MTASRRRFLIGAGAMTLALPALPRDLQAETIPRDYEHDRRVRFVKWRPHDVVRVDTVLRFITSIEFEQGEQITSILAGDTASFDIVRLKAGNILSIKPLFARARTNVNVFTNRRAYVFDLRSHGRAKALKHRLVFRYPPDPAEFRDDVQTASLEPQIGANMAYEAAGLSDFRPLRVWDDGVNTFVQFSAAARRPAIFRADREGAESATNTVQRDPMTIQVIGLSDFWTLRVGGEIVCVRRRNAVPQGGAARVVFAHNRPAGPRNQRPRVSRTFGVAGNDR